MLLSWYNLIFYIYLGKSSPKLSRFDELCFEQAWKVMKEILEEHGYEEGAIGTPKTILKTAYQAGLIKDEELWLRALQERSNVAHSYNKMIALEIATQAKETFYDLFSSLKKEMENHWLQ